MRKSIGWIIVALLLFVATACSNTSQPPVPAQISAPPETTPLTAAPAPDPSDDEADTDSGAVLFGSNDKEQIAAMLGRYPRELDVQAAVNADMFVAIHGIVEPASKQAWDGFYSTVQTGKDASVIILQCTVEGDPILTYVSYMDNQYYYYEDITRDAFGSEEQDYYDGTYNFLKIFELDQGTYALVASEDLASLDEYEAMDMDVYRALFFVNAEI